MVLSAAERLGLRAMLVGWLLRTRVLNQDHLTLGVGFGASSRAARCVEHLLRLKQRGP